MEPFPLSPVEPGILNLGVVAHVDAGKTSLTERLLFAAGVTTALGSVDAGTTRTDSLDLERQRGITIRAAVTTFPLHTRVGDLTINLLDTPGHPDFIAEVERSLGVLDAAVLVLSAVEGVQPQTVVIWRALRRIGVPTVLFVNKVDRSGADVNRVAAQVRQRLGVPVVSLSAVASAGGHQADVASVPLDAVDVVTAVAEIDDPILARWVEGEPIARDQVRAALRRGTRSGALAPLLCGSAITGAGVDLLSEAIVDLLGRRSSRRQREPAGTVFAVDRDERGRRAWVRMWSGQLRLRDRISFDGSRPRPVTELAVSAPGGPRPATAVGAGQIAVVRGPAARIGDVLGAPPTRGVHRFPPPSRQALVEPDDPRDRGALFAGLSELADEDPLIGLRLDEAAGEAAVSLHGEVQKEILAEQLAARFGVTVRFLDTTVICLERVHGQGAATERIREQGNPYLAGIGLHIEPAEVGHGVEFSPGVERGNLPPAFIAATEEGVRAALRQGRYGWAVTDCLVTMTSSQYWPRQSRPHQKFDKSISSVAADFRLLAQVVVAAALDRAGTRVCEPVELFDLELPEEAYPTMAALLGQLGGVVLDTAPGGHFRLTGHLPAAAIPELAARLPDLTSGEGILVTRPDHHAPVTGVPPRRRRNGVDPRDRQRWFREMKR